MGDEVKRLDFDKNGGRGVVLCDADAALLQALVDAARKRDHHELSCATQQHRQGPCDCGFHETIDTLTAIDARLSERR